ncbi:MAG: type II toxin-antitoxin system VapC family toxin [Oxalobacteraceae bacterium]|nr:type II toxin-antitoxin system VapC family toxin [Oxalobacteraceae bacterium]
MRILLDTHIYLWWLQDHPKLSALARDKIISATEVYVSSASIWEASIKIGIGKLEADIAALVAQIAENGFLELPVYARHAMQLTRLPEFHRDPFDRMLVAQAMCEPLRLLTADAQVARYSELVDLV